MFSFHSHNYQTEQKKSQQQHIAEQQICFAALIVDW
jgi:hypothetical protein